MLNYFSVDDILANYKLDKINDAEYRLTIVLPYADSVRHVELSSDLKYNWNRAYGFCNENVQERILALFVEKSKADKAFVDACEYRILVNTYVNATEVTYIFTVD